MSDLRVLEKARARDGAGVGRERRARHSHRVRVAISVIAFGLVALLGFMASGTSGPTSVGPRREAAALAAKPPPAPINTYGTELAPPSELVQVRLSLPLRSGLLFDVRSGRVLWERDPGRVLPVASLTKMMTALVVVAHAWPAARVLITPAAIHFTGSGVGQLPLGKSVPLEALLYGLLLPSGNDAAIALAQHVAGNQARFISMMNARARVMGLRCTHFTTVSGIVDRGNHSCASDLAAIAYAVLDRPRLATIVGSRSAVLPFPIKGGKLFLYNNNPLLIMGYPGTDGVKTGFTNASGQCLVATARRGRTWLGVVLLHSADPPDQAQTLLSAGFATPGA